MIGQRFGRLTVIGAAPRGVEKRGQWLCRCDCGTEKAVLERNLRDEKTRSCGCLSRELKGERSRNRIKHGHQRGKKPSPTLGSWQSMVGRCTKPNDRKYAEYGGRGITVCERWLTFENFLTDMGERPAGKTLDRYPNGAGNYEPGNCRWATPAQQVANRACSVMLEAEGRKLTLGEWAREKGLPYNALWIRLIKKGWPVERALNEPLNTKQQRFR